MTQLKGFPFDQCDQFIDRLDKEPDAIRVFALGDSWLTVPGGWWSGRSVVQLLNDPKWVRGVDTSSPKYNVISISKVGMLAEDMSHDRHLIAIDYIASEMARRRHPFRFDAVIVSAGGNDIIPEIKALVHGGIGVAAINDLAWHQMLQRLSESWQDLLKVLSALKAPILTNGYGPIYPTLKSGKTWLPFLGFGPWTGPYLLGNLELSPADARAIVSAVLDRYNEYLKNLSGVRYFDLRPTVAALGPSEWHDEIHFFEHGWDAVARAWLMALRANIPGRIPMPTGVQETQGDLMLTVNKRQKSLSGEKRHVDAVRDGRKHHTSKAKSRKTKHPGKGK
jgi:hypothetical protein